MAEPAVVGEVINSKDAVHYESVLYRRWGFLEHWIACFGEAMLTSIPSIAS